MAADALVFFFGAAADLAFKQIFPALPPARAGCTGTPVRGARAAQPERQALRASRSRSHARDTDHAGAAQPTRAKHRDYESASSDDGATRPSRGTSCA